MPTVRQERAGKRAEPTLRERYAAVRERIAAAAKRAGHPADAIVLVAITKYAAIDQVRELIELGHVDFGESQVQNLVQRAAQIDEFLQRRRQLGGGTATGAGRAGGLGGTGGVKGGGGAGAAAGSSGSGRAEFPQQVRWHMVGHLQRNKVRKLMGVVRLIHSVDSLRLAEEIQAIAARQDEPIEVLVQVNMFGEKSKFGIAPAATRHLIDQIDTMLNIRVRGVMIMAPLAEDAGELRSGFTRARELFEDIRRTGAGGERFDILSMGMSNDFEIAIEAGANLVRVGSAIFGEPAEGTHDGEE